MPTWTPHLRWVLLLTIIDTIPRAALNWEQVEIQMGHVFTISAMQQQLQKIRRENNFTTSFSQGISTPPDSASKKRPFPKSTALDQPVTEEDDDDDDFRRREEGEDERDRKKVKFEDQNAGVGVKHEGDGDVKGCASWWVDPENEDEEDEEEGTPTPMGRNRGVGDRQLAPARSTTTTTTSTTTAATRGWMDTGEGWAGFQPHRGVRAPQNHVPLQLEALGKSIAGKKVADRNDDNVTGDDVGNDNEDDGNDDGDDSHHKTDVAMYFDSWTKPALKLSDAWSAVSVEKHNTSKGFGAMKKAGQKQRKEKRVSGMQNHTEMKKAGKVGGGKRRNGGGNKSGGGAGSGGPRGWDKEVIELD